MVPAILQTQESELENIDVKHLRWVSEIVEDGSVIRSLSGRSAKLADGTSRNPKDRDAVIAQRTRDLEGMAGQLRGFSLEEFSTLMQYRKDQLWKEFLTNFSSDNAKKIKQNCI